MNESKTPNDADTKFELGCQYDRGKNNLDINLEESMRSFTHAANQSHAGAQCYLGAMYYSGEGGVQSNVMALGWFLKICRSRFC